MNELGAANGERRIRERKNLSAPIKTRFMIELDADIADISPEGISLKLDLSKQVGLSKGKTIQLHIDMNGKVVSLDGEIRQTQISSEGCKIGITYNRDQLTLFGLK